jgi:poly-gamma-glutamate synthesis protein (capsule biosynthesis protein)
MFSGRKTACLLGMFWLAMISLSACRPAAALSAVEPVMNVTSEILPSPTISIRISSPTPLPTVQPSPTPIPTLLPTNVVSTPTITSQPITTLLFTGIIVPARCVQAALDEIGDPNYPYAEIKGLIQGADLAVGVLNASLSEFTPRTGCVPTYLLTGDPANAGAMQRAGFDLVSVATNHIKDCGVPSCGDRAFFDTLDNLKQAGILHVGAGNNVAEALQPVVIELNGVRFAFISLGDSRQGEHTFASPDNAGIAHLTSENIQTALAAARQVADVVIALPHWGPEDESVPNWIQRGQADELAAGADLIIGNHTHVIQGIEQIGEVPVFYGLGNFVFDQGLRDHRQSIILMVRFEGNKLLDYRLFPAHTDPDGRVHLADAQEAAEILLRLDQSSAQIQR